jgi:hypothetical protein
MPHPPAGGWLELFTLRGENVVGGRGEKLLVKVSLPSLPHPPTSLFKTFCYSKKIEHFRFEKRSMLFCGSNKTSL